METASTSLPTGSTYRRRPRAIRYVIPVCALVISAGILVYGCNYVLVGSTLAKKLAEDPRNKTFSLSAHYEYYVIPGTLVLNLTHSQSSAPADLFRGIFQSAEALSTSGKSFEWVVLARAGEPVFRLSGADFSEIGREYSAGQNPVYLIRTFPEKLYTMSGERAFTRWEGGILGVLGKQMSDANDAARIWTVGREQ